MSDDDAMRSVNIRVEGDVWDSLKGNNRSEIARNALRSYAGIRRDARDALKYASEYEEALEELKELEAQIKVKRQMTHEELEDKGFGRFVLPEDPKDDMSTFEETIFFASQQCEEYVGHDYDDDQIVTYLQGDMAEEGHQLPRAVAEWVLEKVREKQDGEE